MLSLEDAKGCYNGAKLIFAGERVHCEHYRNFTIRGRTIGVCMEPSRESTRDDMMRHCDLELCPKMK
jgi:hypothetical protein